MIGQLGDFLRMTLQNPGTEEIELEKELEFLKRYLGIEQLRFQERLNTQFDIDPETLHALVPNLILQPVVENAVRHGIAEKSNSGTIRIQTERRNGQLCILIHDDGPGIPAKILEGIGLSATRDRLQRMYGSGAALNLSNNETGGTIVTVAIPFRTSREAH
jgi:LytS/YehU family sensor histidine kinase